MNHILASLLKRESSAFVSKITGIPAASPHEALSALPGAQIFAHHDQNIATLKRDQLLGKANTVRFSAVAGKPMRLNSRAV